MLIVALGILTLLSVLALTFVSIMRLEQVASTNYVDGVKARLVAEGGLESTAAALKVRALGESFSDPNADWIYASGNYWLPIEEATAIRRGDTAAGDTPALNARRASFAGILAASYSKGVDQFKVKVLDAQTQFNLNSRYEIIGEVDQVYCRFLDTLGVAISKRTDAGTSSQGRNPILFARYPKGSPTAFRGAEALFRFRQSREGQRFNSKSELMEVLANEEDFNLLQDYVTTRSWFDPNTVTAANNDGLNNRPWGDVQKKEERSPININLASKEIIAANLAGIAGRFIYLYTGDYSTITARQQEVEAGTPFVAPAFKEETGYKTEGVLVYIHPFGYQPGAAPFDPPQVTGAMKFAKLIWDRIRATGPFRTFAEWEDFVDATLNDGYLETTKDDDTGQFVFPGHDRGAEPLMLQLDQDALGTMKVGEPAPLVMSAADVKRQLDYKRRFYEAVRSMIKANFNPNPRLSGWNPDAVVYLPCDKGSLLFPADLVAPSSTKTQRQTNEWCLASKGIFEITSLGEVLGMPPEDITKGTERIIYSQAKVQGVVQLYETLTHTTQRDFERNGFTYQGDTNRFGALTFPVAKLFWDPRGEVPATQEKDKLNAAEGLRLGASDVDGHLQLASRTQLVGADIDNPAEDTRIIELGNRRFELLLQDRHLELPGSPAPSNDDVLFADSSGGIINADNMGVRPSTGRPKNGFGWPFGDAPNGVAPATRSGDPQEAWKWDTVTPDGYLNSELRKTRLWYRASDTDSTGPVSGTPEGWRRGRSGATGGNVTPTNRGGFEFWYKPDFDWTMPGSTLADPRFCGLLATSHIAQNDGFTVGAATPGSWSRGTQMYLTRTTSGDLRITRLFFEVVGPTGSTQEEPRVRAPVPPNDIITFTEYLNRAASIQAYTWPPAELLTIPTPYKDILFSRTDNWVPYNQLADWRAREWHHIAAYWDDRTGEVKLWLDGAQKTLVARAWPTVNGRRANERYVPVVLDPANPTGPPIPATAFAGTDGKLPSFVRLNAHTGPETPPPGKDPIQYEDSLMPKDQVYIGGVRRDQAVSGGLFKHDSVAFLPANGTIDDVRFFDGATSGGATAPASRYDVGSEVGHWTNEFDLSRAFQNGVGEITLAGIQFTAYLPTHYGITPVTQNGDVRVDFRIVRQDGSTVANPAWTCTMTERASPCEIKLLDGTMPVRVARGDTLVYRVFFTAAQTPAGSPTTGAAFATPVLDDISLVYYLPNAVVLLKERVIN